MRVHIFTFCAYIFVSTGDRLPKDGGQLLSLPVLLLPH